MTDLKLATALGLAAALFSAGASAQTSGGETAPVPVGGALVEENGTPLDTRIEAPGLPGVGDPGAASPRDASSGPGGLQNGVGAIGTMAPSTSSYNPVPVPVNGQDAAGMPIAPLD